MLFYPHEIYCPLILTFTYLFISSLLLSYYPLSFLHLHSIFSPSLLPFILFFPSPSSLDIHSFTNFLYPTFSFSSSSFSFTCYLLLHSFPCRFFTLSSFSFVLTRCSFLHSFPYYYSLFLVFLLLIINSFSHSLTFSFILVFSHIFTHNFTTSLRQSVKPISYICHNFLMYPFLLLSLSLYFPPFPL